MGRAATEKTSVEGLFGPATRAWFDASFAGATPVQARGWPPIVDGQHALLCAPTGSGKTLAAFLACLDRLTRTPTRSGVRVLYISPLKALAYDVERNLRAPLAGIQRAADGLGISLTQIRTASRTGDTPAKERRLIGRDPSEILITTPESLYLMLGSEVRSILTGVETVIVDEIHALAPTKRGCHLALSLERLSALVVGNGGKDPQRIGLSATQRPLEEVARFLGGARPVTIIDAGEKPRLELTVEVPVDDMEAPPPAAPPSANEPRKKVGPERLSTDSTAAEDRRGVWPALHDRVLELIASHRSTIVFTNSRRLCERFAQRINEIWAERGHDDVLVRAHHGSIARETRVEIEELLKEGKLRGIVATSSLELGIDMGAVDLVVQIESPGAVSRGLQRVGRAGHSVGEKSVAKIFPKFKQDLLETTVVARRMLDGDVEPIRVPRNALDVLSQQIVAMTGDRSRSVDEIEALVRGAYPYQTLSRELLVSVLDMLAGRYPSDDIADLRPRVVWDRATDQVVARKDAKLIAVVNAGTIPDRGMYGVYLEGGGPRVGELDEEMVHESRTGQVFLLGASSWRITEITRDRVVVRPAPGEPGRMPFWRGEGPGRPIELGRAVGAFLREMEPKLDQPAAARKHLQSVYRLDERAAENLRRYLDEQRTATGQLPTDRSLVVERFRDELGDWRVCLLSPFGARVHAPLALALEAKLAAKTGHEAQALYSDDGIVLRLADAEAPPALADLLPEPEELEELLLGELRASSLFASHFRENAARALLLPRRRPGKRTPLWAQRLKAQTLLGVAGKYPSFPIVLETFRECMNDIFDVPALVELLAQLRSRQVRLVEVETPRASPFARSLAFAYVSAYLYEGDAPLAERKAQALTLDRDLLRELLGDVEIKELLDPGSLDEVESELQSLAADRHVRSADGVHDLLRRVGDLSVPEVSLRTDGDVPPMLETLRGSGRAVEVRLGGESRWIAVEDVARYRDALGVPVPSGVPRAYLEPVPDALESLVLRWARTHAPFSLESLATRWALTAAQLGPVVRLLVLTGRLLEGAFRTDGAPDGLCDPEVLRRLRRHTLAKLRKEIAPVDPLALARFLPSWHGVVDPLKAEAPRGQGIDRLREALYALEGLALPFSELEGRILPSRLRDYQPRLLDELGAAGELVWVGRGAIGSDDGRVALYFRDHVGRLLDPPALFVGEALHATILAHLEQRGAAFFAQLQAAAPTTLTHDLEAAVWDLVWAGQITNDTFAPLRALSLPRRGARTVTRRPGSVRPQPTLAGRWSLARELAGTSGTAADHTASSHARAMMLLERYGVVTREAAQHEEIVGGFGAVAGVLRAMEESGKVRRGYFVEGLSGSQFALPGALDRLRAARTDEEASTLVLSAIDPANPFGLFVDWPALDADAGDIGRARRAAGALVIFVDARPALFVERGGKKLLVFQRAPDAADPLARAIDALRAVLARKGLRVAEVNGRPALRSPMAGVLERAGFRVEPGGLMLERAP